MKLNDFLTEQWMNDYEGRAVYNMTDTCVQPLSLRELTAMDEDHLLERTILDYGVITGDEKLKEEILRLYHTGSTANIATTHGCLAANEMVMNTFLEPGDTVVTFVPGYQQFTDIPASLGCRVITVSLLEENGWMPDEKELEAAFHSPVKMVILNNPANPTGRFFDEAFLEKLTGYCRPEKTYILSDEIYRGKDPDEISVSDLYEYGISTSGLAKMFSLAGLRMGWIKASEEIIHQLNVRRDYTFISTGPLADTLSCIALRNQDHLIERSRKIISADKQVYTEWLKKEKHASLVMPEKGTVGFLRYEGNIPSRDLALQLLDEHGVFFVPGSCFGCENHLRIGFTRDPEMVAEGLRFLSEKLAEINC